MSYTTKTVSAPYRNTLRYVANTEAGPDTREVVMTGELPILSYQRTGFNNPLNFQLLNLLGRTKNKTRVRFKVKKVTSHYVLRRRRVYYIRYTRKKVKELIPGWFKIVRRKVKKGKNKGKWKLFRIQRYAVSYITVSTLKYRYKYYLKPVKVRVRIPVLYKGVAQELLPGHRPYLLPNALTYAKTELEIHPSSSTSDSAWTNGGGFTALGASRSGAPYFSLFNVEGFGGYVGVGRHPNTQTLLPGPVDDIYLSATSLHGLYKKVASDIPSTLTSLAEAPETIKAVYHILQDGIKLAKSLRKLDARTAYRSVNSLVKSRKDSLSGVSSKVWLSWYLAVAPTINDISEHVSLLSRTDRVWRKFSKSSTVIVDNRTSEHIEGYFSAEVIKTTVKYGCYINGRLTVDQFKSKLTGSDNLSAAAYAVVPFSFIADWIVDVSTYLESASIFTGLDYDAWKTSVYERLYTEKSPAIGYNSQQTARVDPIKWVDRSFRVDREPLPDGLPEMPLIPWKKNLVDQTLINRSLTAAALFRALSSKKN